MSETSERISQLKIDRDAPPPSRSRLPVIIGLAVAAVGIVWFVLAGRSSGVQVETESLLSALLIGVIGGLFPAIRAARLPVAQALREL